MAFSLSNRPETQHSECEAATSSVKARRDMAFGIRAMSLLTALYLGALLIHMSKGQCRTDCQCVSPSSPEDRCCLYIRENLPAGSPVGNANNLTLIEGLDAATYEFTPVNGELGALFNFNTTTGAITTAVPIDRENISSSPVQGDCIGLLVRGLDRDGVRLTGVGHFGIVIEDVNDNRPQFESTVSVLNVIVRESNAPSTLNCEGSVIDLRTRVRATDRDIGSNAEVTYKVAEDHGSTLFRVVNPHRPCVDNLVPMDRENTSVSYFLVLVAMDGGDPQLSSNITVIFTLEDVNDNAPVFLNATMDVNVRENVPIGFVLHQFNATDLDLETQPLRYSLMLSDFSPFQINPGTGELNLTQKLDAETIPMYHLTVLATDSDSVHTSTLNITVNVIDVNEPAMLIRAQPPSELLEEMIPNNNITFSIIITDNDKSEANTMNEIHFVSGGQYFAVEPVRIFGNRQVFRIRQHSKIDRENVTNGTVQLSITIVQMGDPPLEDQFQYNFTILDINDNEPYLNTTQFNITEDDDSQGQSTSTPVRRIQLASFVRDDDAGENGTVDSFTLISVKSTNGLDLTEEFRRSNGLNEANQERIHNGNLQLPTPFDREVFGEALFVTMNFTDGGTPPLSRPCVFSIVIIDINDNLPKFHPTEYTFDVIENDENDFIIGSVNATDADDPATGNGLVVYSLDETQGDYEFFTVDQCNGTIRNKQTFDRETQPRYTFYISANDSGSPPRRAISPARVIVVVLDVNDEPPEFKMDRYTFIVNNGASVGDSVGKVIATDPDENPTENQIAYKFLVPSPYFFISNITGNIILTKVLSIQDSPYNLTVVAFNPGFEHLKTTASISVVVAESNLLVAIIGGVSGSAAFILIVAIFLLCCCIACVRQKSKTGKLRVDGNGTHLNNQKPILKTLPATNGQQRSMKFSTTVEETHYDPSGIEHSVIRKEANIVSGDDSPQTSLRTTGNVPNGAMCTNSPEIVDYDMSPNIGINGDIPSIHHWPQYPHHGRITSPIVLQEELNPSEFSQSTGSVVDDWNTYNSEGEEVESTFSDAPSNFNTSIPRFGRQTVQVEEHHHPADLGRYASPPTHPPLDIHHDLHSHLPPVHHIHGPGQHSSPGHLAELRAHNLAALNAQYASSSHPPGVPPAEDIQDLSINYLPHNIGHNHHHHGSIGSPHASTPPQRHIQRTVPPPIIHQPSPVSIPHSIYGPGQHSSPGHLAELQAHYLAALNGQYASSSHPPHSAPPTEDIQVLTLKSLPHNISHHHRHGNIGLSHTSTQPLRNIRYPPPPSTYNNFVMHQESNSNKIDHPVQTCSDASTLNSDPVFRNLPGNYSQISATTNSSGSSVDVAHLLLQANVTSGHK